MDSPVGWSIPLIGCQSNALLPSENWHEDHLQHRTRIWRFQTRRANHQEKIQGQSYMQYTSCWYESSQSSHWTHVHHFGVRASRTGGRLVSAHVRCRKHESVLLCTWSFLQSCAAYQPPKRCFSHISKEYITKHGKLLGCPLQLLVLVNPLKCEWN